MSSRRAAAAAASSSSASSRHSHTAVAHDDADGDEEMSNADEEKQDQRRVKPESKQDDGGDESAPPPSAAAISMSTIMAGCSFTNLIPLCKELTKGLNDQIKSIEWTIAPTIELAVDWLKRRTAEEAETKEVQERIATWRTNLSTCAKKQYELNMLKVLLQMISADAASGTIEPGRRWLDWLRTNGIALEGRNAKQFEEKEAKIMDEFETAIWKVHHGDEPRPGVDADIIEQAVDETSENALTCKLTHQLFESPLRNTCRHVYSEAAIRAYLLGKQSSARKEVMAAVELKDDFAATCPIAGCKVLVSIDSLTKDRAMEKSVRELKHRQQLNGGSAADATQRTAAAASSSKGRRKGTIKQEDLTQQENEPEEEKDETMEAPMAATTSSPTKPSKGKRR